MKKQNPTHKLWLFRISILFVLQVLYTSCSFTKTTPTEAPTELPIPSVNIVGRMSQPAIAGDVVYFGTNTGYVYAMNRTTAQEIWRLQTYAGHIWRPTVSAGMVYMGGQNGVLYALDANTGELVWDFQAGEVDWTVRDIFINGTPTIQDDVIYFSSEDFNVYALNAKSREEQWRLKLDEEPQALELPIIN